MSNNSHLTLAADYCNLMLILNCNIEVNILIFVMSKLMFQYFAKLSPTASFGKNKTGQNKFNWCIPCGCLRGKVIIFVKISDCFNWRREYILVYKSTILFIKKIGFNIAKIKTLISIL